MKAFDADPSNDLVRALPKKQEGLVRLITEANQHLKAIESFNDELNRTREKAAREVFKAKQTQKTAVQIGRAHV